MTDATDFSLADFLVGFSDDPLVPDEEFARWRRETAWATAQYEPVMTEGPGPRTRILVDGVPRQVINLASYNYLGLARHPEVLDAATAALRRFGLGTCGSPLLSGLTPLHRALEARLAHLVGKPDAMLFNSGFGGALGCLGGLLRRGDIAVLDADAHICLHDGARVAGAQVRTFAHNDPEDLDRVLTQTSDRRRVVVVEGVYSVFGDVVALPAIAAVARGHKVQVMIDEAHSILVLGERGGGVVDHFGLEEETGLIYGTFSKSFAALGGFAAGPVETLDYLRCYANPYAFSCALSAPVVAGVETALRIAVREPQRRARVLAEADWFRAQLQSIGIDTGASAAQVIPIIVGSDRRRLYELGQALRRAGLFLAPFDYPSVPEARLCFRACITAAHQRADLQEALDILDRVVVGRPPAVRKTPSDAGRTSVLMFPGQSSFDPHMLRDARVMWPELTQEVLATSSAALGRDLSGWLDEVRPRGNEDLQVAVFLTTHVHLRALQRVHGDGGRSLGLSLGEYNHLVHIGALDFADGVRLVAARGAAYDRGPSGAMAAMFPLELGELEEALDLDERTRAVEIVNLNSPTQNVIAGETGAVRAAIALIERETFARVVIIDALHPMHSSLYRPVADALRPHLEATPWRPARHSYLPNVTAEPVTDPGPGLLTDMLCRHVCEPVRWRASVDRALREIPGGGRDALFVEVGPGTVLTDLLRAPWRAEPRVSTSHWSRTVEALEGLHGH
ncbi:aminotransferase class I/II-fold pyridoxal phosphate-dependent enzyme [Krasilnikovia sp. MM14-A1259]|uniref:aminotransferase class I/II-fold pyridoxal phosphate-dependent enzyme n=1 Tax=Krasilnikovia sp. MM14-A1259 TaxID=3373539 RepID=UPI003800D082